MPARTVCRSGQVGLAILIANSSAKENILQYSLLIHNDTEPVRLPSGPTLIALSEEKIAIWVRDHHHHRRSRGKKASLLGLEEIIVIPQVGESVALVRVSDETIYYRNDPMKMDWTTGSAA
ncbi:hypothetical protein HOY82DRAFT_595890 [Tuber indicum]|nr:hypothetical protein HOY82DRAFT_595890 [Tuber indicum]